MGGVGQILQRKGCAALIANFLADHQTFFKELLGRAIITSTLGRK